MFTIRHCAALLTALAIAFRTVTLAQEPKSAQLPVDQARLFEATCKTLAETFMKNDVDSFLKLCLPKDLLAEVLAPKVLERGTEALHKQMLEANAKRFAEFRKRFQDLEGFQFVSAEVGYRLERADTYSDPKLILKNSYFTIGYANRIILKIKIEDMVFIGGKYYIIQLD